MVDIDAELDRPRTCSRLLDTVGTHSITGIYQGDGNYNGITSSVLPQPVQ